MRNHPSFVYFHDELCFPPKANEEFFTGAKHRRTFTLGIKVEQHQNKQFLIAALSVVHPKEDTVDEVMDTTTGLDSFPKPVDPPKSKYPFVKAEGRNEVLKRIVEATTEFRKNPISQRGKGYVIVANDHGGILNSRYYQDLQRFVHLGPEEVFPFLSMSKRLIIDIALELFNKADASEYRYNKIDIGFAFNSKEL